MTILPTQKSSTSTKPSISGWCTRLLLVAPTRNLRCTLSRLTIEILFGSLLVTILLRLRTNTLLILKVLLFLWGSLLLLVSTLSGCLEVPRGTGCLRLTTSSPKSCGWCALNLNSYLTTQCQGQILFHQTSLCYNHLHGFRLKYSDSSTDVGIRTPNEVLD